MVYRKKLNKVKSYEPGKPIEEVKRSLGIKEVYKLASNEIPFVPSYAFTAIRKELQNINRYPESSSFYLRKQLAQELKVKETQIVLGNGSDEVITLVLRALIEKNDEVIVAYPTFLVYEIQAAIEEAKVVKVPLADLRYSLDKIAAKVNKKTKIIFIANPDNPTGTYLTESDIKRFIKKIPKKVLIFFDEAYFEFAPGDFPKTLDLLKQRGNIIVTRTFSKVYGLAGLRIGYGVTTEELAKALNKVREPFNINRIAQVAAIAALENKDFVKKVLKFVESQKTYFYRELAEAGLDFIKSATNFILVNFKNDAKPLCNYLLKKGVIVRDLSGWGLKGFFRVTVGLPKENKKFIKYLRIYLKRG